jgi:Flp pilus assembly pilin Flp
VGLIAAVCITIVGLLGGKIVGKFTAACQALNNNNPC